VADDDIGDDDIILEDEDAAVGADVADVAEGPTALGLLEFIAGQDREVGYGDIEEWCGCGARRQMEEADRTVEMSGSIRADRERSRHAGMVARWLKRRSDLTWELTPEGKDLWAAYHPAPPPPDPPAPRPDELRSAHEGLSKANERLEATFQIYTNGFRDYQSKREALDAAEAQQAEREADALLQGDPKKAGGKVPDLDGQKDALAKAERLLAALRRRWGAASAVQAEARRRLAPLEHRQALATARRAKRVVGEQEHRLSEAKNALARAESEAAQLHREAEKAGEPAGKVYYLRGAPEQLLAALDDPEAVVDRVAVSKLLSEWRRGLQSHRAGGGARVAYPVDIIIYANASNGDVLAHDIVAVAASPDERDAARYLNAPDLIVPRFRLDLENRVSELARSLEV